MEALSAHTKKRLESASCPAVANALLKRGLDNVYLLGLNPVSSDQPTIVGPAYTLRFIPARADIDSMSNYSCSENLHRRAIEECPAGAVLVIDAQSNVSASSAGDMMSLRLKVRGVAGLITDGGLRDTQAIARSGLAMFHRRAAPPATPIALHPTELDGPIGCAGVAIYPGDIMMSDSEGVVAIPRHLVDDVALEAAEAQAYEEFAADEIRDGRSIFGLFPASEESHRKYRIWLTKRSKQT